MFTTIETLRQENFARSYQWEVHIPDYSSELVPCTSCSYPVATFLLGESDYGTGTVVFPERIEPYDISLELVETHDFKLEKYFNEWDGHIYKSNYTVNYLAASYRKIDIYLLALDKSIIKMRSFKVLPEGNIMMPFGSEKGGGITLTVELKVVGEG